jgi:DNA-binding response OmpR family regulator
VKTVLCVEDDKIILENNIINLTDGGYNVLTAETVAEARERLSRSAPDGIVLDIMLPDGNGLDLLRELREAGNKVPVIMLTAWGEPPDVARGLKLGANDYLPKPLAYEELLARLETMFRNVEQVPEVISKERLVLKMRSMEVHFNDQKVKLSPVEFFLLQLFMENEDKDLKTEYLYGRVWGADMNDDPNAVKITVTRLRKKIAGSGYIVSAVYGIGYRFGREM